MVPVRRSLWHEPRPRDAAPVGRDDVLLGGAYAVVALLEGAFRPDLTWRIGVTALALLLVPALVWRRPRPLAGVLLAWGVAGLLAVLQLSTDVGDLGLDAMTAVLVPLYALARWGSGREIAVGTTFVAGVATLGMLATSATWTERIGGIGLLGLVVAIGAVFRYRADLGRRQQVEVRNEERMALARELHDTVAHHVSAIAVQAQAGGVIAASQPERAAAILAAIEVEASRTLAEMRSMVRALREEDAVDYAPQAGVADLPALARPDGTPRVVVSLDGALTRLPRPVDGALFRLAQESLTNAVRHARGATRIGIEVRREGDVVRLRVVDDGRTSGSDAARHGFGLRGMGERAQLLGGSCKAGPGAGGGWVVEAVLPVDGPA